MSSSRRATSTPPCRTGRRTSRGREATPKTCPVGRRTRGKDAAVSVLQQVVGAWDEFSLAADEFFEDDDTVVVLGHTDVKKRDQSAKLPVVHIWRFRGDDEVCRLHILTDTLHGARLLGKA